MAIPMDRGGWLKQLQLLVLALPLSAWERATNCSIETATQFMLIVSRRVFWTGPQRIQALKTHLWPEESLFDRRDGGAPGMLCRICISPIYQILSNVY